MKLWSRLCFLVLALPSVSRGQSANTTTTPGVVMDASQGPSDDTHHEVLNATSVTKATTPTPHPHITPSSSAITGNGEEGKEGKEENVENTTVDGEGTASATTPNALERDIITTPGPGVLTTSTTPSPVTGETVATKTDIAELPADVTDNSSWGYVILAFIIVMIIVLFAVLYILRRVARTYSFDLQRPPPGNHFNEPTGTFEPVYLDDLERPVPTYSTTMDDLSTPPVANGTSLQAEEKTSVEENAAQEQLDANGVETSPPNTSPSLVDDQADTTSDPLSSADLFLDSIGEQQNENNNNPSVCSTDPFVEINLDDPEWCDQLIASTDTPSLSPFSFSSSSS